MGQILPFTEDDLRRAAGPASYARGVGYLDRVEQLAIAGTWVTAIVYGTDVYQVRLKFDDERADGLRGDCSCPFGAEGNFCKHCVATGLVALRSGASAAPARGTAAPAPPGLEPGSFISWLSSLSRDELLIELFELLADEPQLCERFELRAAARRVDVEGVRAVVRRLIWVTDYVDHDQASAYAGDVDRAAEAIEELIDAGAAAAAVGVVRDAIAWLRQSFATIDDSSGDVGNAGYGLLNVHLLACQEAQPDPVELAEYLADQCLTDQYGLTPALMDYAELLGDVGRAALRARVAAAYDASPDDSHVRGVLESVIEAEGDIDALVAVCARHLDQFGYQHLRIAHALDKAGRPDEALGWAERGVASSPQPSTGLVDYLVDRYASAGREADVVSLRRTLFSGYRSLANFRALRAAATNCGVWDAEREAALDLLRTDAAAARGKTLWFPWAGPVLIDALIDEGDTDAAWIAARDIASGPQWIRLANASASSRPADALAVYRKVIEGLTQKTGDAVYREIATHLLAARACHEALGTMDKFRQYMVVLRMGQKRKRNLMAILDRSGL
jgi:SWIM zinc finger